jgi:DNA-binding transcriptional ArsR family regulator
MHPLRIRLLRALHEPASAATVARELGLPRQKVNYHLRELERAGFLEEVEQRRKGNCIERIVRATAASYLVNPDIAGQLGETASEARDRFSSAYLVATAARIVRDVAVLRERANSVGKELPTLTLEADVRFKSAGDRNAFSDELSRAVAGLVSKYDDPEAKHGRAYRFVLSAHPAVTKSEQEAAAEAAAYKEQQHD